MKSKKQMKGKIACLLMSLALFAMQTTAVLAATTFQPKIATGFSPAGSSKQYHCWLGGTSERVAADMTYPDENGALFIRLSAYMFKPNGTTYVGIRDGLGVGSAEACVDAISGWPITSATGSYFIRSNQIAYLTIW